MLSIIIPCYKSEQTVAAVVHDVVHEMNNLSLQYQIILVNDGSPDGTFSVIKELCAENHNITGVDLSRNFGRSSAWHSALPYVKGDAILSMDDDGEHPVSGIKPLLDKLNEGYDIVFARFRNNHHGLFKRMGSKLNALMNYHLNEMPKDLEASSFSVLRSFIAKELTNYRNPMPNSRGFIFRVTQKVAMVDVDHHPRLAGKSNFTFKKMFALWLNGLIGFSALPLRIASLFGFIFSMLGLVSSVVLIIRKILNPAIAMGYTSTMAVLLLTGGIIMLILGIIGEYLGRIYNIINHLPQYVVREALNADSSAPLQYAPDKGESK